MDNSEQAPSIFLVTGSVQGGKTTFLIELVELLKKRGLSIGGFLAKGSFDKGERSAFVLHNIEDGTEVAMASAHETAKWIKYRRFWFNPDAFIEGMEWTRRCLIQKPDVLVIDEVGPMEMEGSGWMDIINFLENEFPVLQLWSVRESLLGEVMQRWEIPEDNLIRIDKAEMNQVADRIYNMANKHGETKQK